MLDGLSKKEVAGALDGLVKQVHGKGVGEHTHTEIIVMPYQ